MLHVKKGETIQYKGELNTKVFIVESGLLRSYTIDEKGKEHIYMFAPEGWIVSDATDKMQPSQLYIDALEDTVIRLRDKEDISQLDVTPLLKRLEVLQKRIIMLMSASALERYEDFAKTYPNIIQRVPQKMIASYLGITPEALSKLKSEKVKKKHV